LMEPEAMIAEDTLEDGESILERRIDLRIFPLGGGGHGCCSVEGRNGHNPLKRFPPATDRAETQSRPFWAFSRGGKALVPRVQ
jgi:hypothetical protein